MLESVKDQSLTVSSGTSSIQNPIKGSTQAPNWISAPLSSANLKPL